MSDWLLLVPKTKAAIVAWVLAVGSVSYSDTIGLGSIIVTAVVIIAAGLFTLRNNLKTFWKNLAEERGTQVIELEKHLKDATAERAAFEGEQREIRHQLKNELAAVRAQLAVETQNRDLTKVYDGLDRISVALAEQTPLLEQILEKLG